MTQKELIDKTAEDNCFDNPALEENCVKTSVIFVKPRSSDIESPDHSSATFDLPIRPNNSIDDSDVESSSDSLEVLNLDESHMKPKMNIPNYHIDDQNGSTDGIKEATIQAKKKEPKLSRHKMDRSISTNIFEDPHSFWDVIETSQPMAGIVDPRRQLMKFLFSPPPKGVVVKCQINKTIKKDKTLMFTKFVFSLQISDTGDDLKRDVLTLMAARARKKTRTLYYLISTDVSDLKSSSSTIIGNLRGNLLGSYFKIGRNKSPHGAIASNEDIDDNNSDDSHADGDGVLVKEVDTLGIVFYKSNFVLKRKPRRVDVATPYWDDKEEMYLKDLYLPTDRADLSNAANMHLLENIEPTYNKDINCFTLDFGGRAKRTSAKNFALKMKVDDKEKRVYQFGKCRDHYIVDYTYPLCAFQAFAIGLSSVHRKMISD